MSHDGSGMPPLVCIVCVEEVDPTSDEAEGWVLVRHDVGEGDEHDDAQWKCPLHATASDEFFGDRVKLAGPEDDD